MAWSTKNAARSAVCCATLMKQTMIRGSLSEADEKIHLFCFDGVREFRGECDVSDGYVI